MAIHRGYVPLIICAHIISLRCEHEQSASHTGDHYGIVHYGTDPSGLSETAKSPIRLNPDHSSTVFRVRIDGLQPRTTYYYTVDSIETNGKGDGVRSAVKHFTTR